MNTMLSTPIVRNIDSAHYTRRSVAFDMRRHRKTLTWYLLTYYRLYSGKSHIVGEIT